MVGISDAEKSRRYRERHPDRIRATKAAYRARNRDKIRLADNAQSVSTRIQRRMWLDNYKLSTGCVDCGYAEHPRALDFDHIGTDKVGNVGRLAHHRIAWDRLMAEIAKCEVVCSNCHRVRTWRREQGRRPKPADDVEQIDGQEDLFGEVSA